MAEFLEERLPVTMKYGASYADDYAVEITTTAGGQEYRKLVHPFPVRIFNVSFMEENAKLYTEILNLYHRAYGKFAGFRAKAIDDFTTNAEVNPPTATDQTLLLVSPGVYQLTKFYGTDAPGLTIGPPHRVIFKPVAGTILIAVDGAIMDTGAYTVDITTGLITFGSDPGSAAVTGGCEFDIPVRFNQSLDVHQNNPVTRELDNIELIELLKP